MQPKSMGKRGAFELNLWVIVQLVIVISLVFFPLWEFALSDSFKLFDRIFLSKDFALTLDAVYASPQDLVLNYPQPTKGIGLNISPFIVSAFYEGITDVIKPPTNSYYFMEDEITKISYVQFSIRKLMPYASEKERKEFSVQPTIMKTPGKIDINFLGFSYNPEQETILAIPTAKEIKDVLINTIPNKEANEQLKTIASFLDTQLKKEMIFTTQLMLAAGKNDIQGTSSELLVNLEIINDPMLENRLLVKISANKDDTAENKIKSKNVKLASIIVNSFISSQFKDKLQNSPELVEVRDNDLLNSKDLAVTIQLGNIGTDEGKRFLSNQNYPEITSIIYDAIKKYNE